MRNLKINFVVGILLVVAILLVQDVLAAEKSTSVVKTQYFSPEISNPYSSEYSVLYTGNKTKERKEEIFDLLVAVPPFGCKPAVVRSDLLEEQNVPVFCQLMAVKVNPSIDISRLDKIVAKEREKSPYVAGIGFHPARAAIKSTGKLVSSPIDTNLGYIVIVLKQIEAEKEMPDFVEVNLSAHLLYGSEYGFGIGQTEFYVPVLTNEEWANDYKSYGFFSGQGYLRVEDIDEKGALVSIYRDVDSKIYSSRLEKGKTYDNIYLSNNYGGQGLKILVEDFVVPKTKAKLIVGSDVYEVYEGEKFADNCRLRKAAAYGGGTGYAEVVCGSESAVLTKEFGKVKLNSNEYKIGDEISRDLGISNKKIYVAYLGVAPFDNKAFVVLAESKNELNNERLASIRTDLSRKISQISASNLNDFKKTLEKISIFYVDKLHFVFSGEKTNIPDGTSNGGKNKIQFSGAEYENKELNKEVKTMYEETIKNYEEVIESFGSESFNKRDSDGGNTNKGTEKVYAQEALCRMYLLAKDLMQNLDAREYLMRLNDDYAGSACVVNGAAKTASELLSEQEVYNDELTEKFFEKSNLYVKLVSVTEPAEKEASVKITYVPVRGNKFGNNGKKEESLTLKKEEVVADLGDDKKTKITLVSFDENKATISYSCEVENNQRTTRTSEKRKEANEKGIIDLDECNGQILIEGINLKKVAKIKITPKTSGRSAESNFSVKIGIEKRAIQLSPEKTAERIANLNKTIEKWSKINENLGKLVEGGKAACLATSAALTIKNFFSGMSGEASARQKVMTMEGGWNDICQQNYEKWGYPSVDACLSSKSKEIDASVKEMARIMKEYNDAEKARIESATQAGKGILGADKVDYDKVLKEQLAKVKELGNGIAQRLNEIDIEKDGINSYELRELEVNAKLASSNEVPDEIKNAARQKADRILEDIYKRGENRRAVEQTAKNLEIDANHIHIIKNQRTIHEPYETLLFKNLKLIKNRININDNDKVAILRSASPNGLTYLAVLEGTRELRIKDVYKIENRAIKNLEQQEKNSPDFRETTNVVFDLYDASSYHNRCENCEEAKFYNSGSYKGLPSLIPFDVDNGWYVATKPLSPLLGEAKTFQDSGRVNSFYVCNVDGNKRIDGIGIGDDVCRRFDMYTGDTLDSFPSLSREESKKLVAKAIKALEDASRQLAENPNARTIIINGKLLKVVGVSGTPGGKCTDFMSPSDCKILFNVCDPFVCPSSRCDLGGSYQVDDVIQSGIIGSIVLCLPNFVGFGGDVYVPVCLTGVHAGIEGWLSILKAHQSCLQEHIKSGKMVGLCDEIYSIYQCDFFWRQLAPFLKEIVKGLLKGTFLGSFGMTRGGGEYLFVDEAFKNTENSFKYFTSTYASTSKLGFGAVSLAEIGTEICKRQFSVAYPDKFKAILEPESPTQFHAWFDEIPYSTASVPSTSQYKVFYHIYAGEDQGAYYTIYLKSKETALGYVGIPQIIVASDYIGKGETKTETKDFTAVSGFKELCVRINAKDECGFKQVSSSFALNYAKDVVVADQAKKQITTERECIAGSPSIGSLLNPNLQAGVEDVISPELYNQGVIRVCSSRNPGESVEPARWKLVGYCGDENVKCWLDVNSVKNAIKGKGIENKTLEEINAMDKEALISEGFYNDAKGNEEISNLKTKYNGKINSNEIKTIPDWLQEFDKEVNDIYIHLIYNYQKADILYYKAEIYEKITRDLVRTTS